MRYRELTEAQVYWDVADPQRENTMVPIYSLRTPNDLRAVLRMSKSNGELRGLVADDLVLAWDSFKEVHGGVIDELRMHDVDYPDESAVSRDWYGLVYFYPDGVAMAPKRGGDFKRVIANPIIQAIYRGHGELRDVRPGSG